MLWRMQKWYKFPSIFRPIAILAKLAIGMQNIALTPASSSTLLFCSKCHWLGKPSSMLRMTSFSPFSAEAHELWWFNQLPSGSSQKLSFVFWSRHCFPCEWQRAAGTQEDKSAQRQQRCSPKKKGSRRTMHKHCSATVKKLPPNPSEQCLCHAKTGQRVR